ncbi:hypothetical protein [Methyloglobulus sp.]|uniref:hypothetical protein n=1 Tax=Methyloglobulus sp. TaxID=2518622 RepID=UPI0039892DDE
MWYTTIALCLVVIIQGCATLRPDPETSLSGEDAICFRWFENIEATLGEHDLNDPETVHINGFPHLRTNRFLASMADRATSKEAFAEWLEQMRQLDAKGKKLEFANLPAIAMQQLVAEIPTGGSFDQALKHCGKRSNKLSLNNPKHKKILLEQAQVPDAYHNWKRVVGLYPLARYVAGIGIERLHRELDTSFKIPPEKLPLQGKLIRYSPPHSGMLTPEHISTMLGPAYDNPLGVPHLTSLQLQQLLANFAPVWEIDTRNDTDKIGTVSLANDKQPRIDINQPTVYVAQGYTRWRGKVLLQLIYQIWLPAREKTSMLDLYGGPLDSVIWRVTLSPEGKPIAFDSIHGCGCYYLLFPGQGYRAVSPNDGAEPVLSPKSITTLSPGHRLLLRLQGRTHYLQQVSLVGDISGTATRNYIFQDSEELRSLQMPNGAKRSLYGEDGIIDASGRAERFLFWPYGIASPGAMRQWGTHAIAFIGRRHFDDPFLLDNLVAKE